MLRGWWDRSPSEKYVDLRKQLATFNGDTNKVDSWPVTAIRIAYQCVLEACLLERAKGARPTVRENNDPPTILVSFRPVILLIGEGWLVMNALGRASVSAKKDSGHEL